MNKLDEIIAKEYGCNDINEVLHDFAISPAMIKQCMIEFAKHILEEAFLNSKLQVINHEEYRDKEDLDLLDEYECGSDTIIVNKQSITDTLNKYL